MEGIQKLRQRAVTVTLTPECSCFLRESLTISVVNGWFGGRR